MASPPPTPAFQSVYPPVLASITKPGGGVTDSMRMWMQQVSATLPNGGAFALNQFITNIFNAVSGNFTVSSKVLTNTQIKALPTTPITIMSAPGAGLLIVPIMMASNTNFTAASYTNVNVDAFIDSRFTGGSGWSNFLANDSTLGYTYVSDVFTSNAKSSWTFVPYTKAEPIFGWGNIMGPDSAWNDNQGVQITMNNAGSGNLTGGNAANVWTLNLISITVSL